MTISALILAGGLGTRLREVVPDLPKPLAPVAGRPFLDWLLDWLESGGVADVVVSAGYRSQAMIAWAAARTSTGRIPVRVVVEPEPLGTGGAVRFAAAGFAGSRLLVLNGDSFVAADLPTFLRFDQACGGAFSLIAPEVDDVSRYGALTLDDDHRIQAFQEKGGTGPGVINGGIYALDPELLARLPLGPCSLERDGLAQWLGLGGYAHAGAFRFIDIGTPESFQAAQQFFGVGASDG
ncbi:MAG: nucleotidyl transferase [Alphaproteobacteria bacterium]|nr:MAG: nucleotidyl transferase [Alphaproteobacteria bacterium]